MREKMIEIRLRRTQLSQTELKIIIKKMSKRYPKQDKKEKNKRNENKNKNRSNVLP